VGQVVARRCVTERAEEIIGQYRDLFYETFDELRFDIVLHGDAFARLTLRQGVPCRHSLASVGCAHGLVR